MITRCSRVRPGHRCAFSQEVNPSASHMPSKRTGSLNSDPIRALVSGYQAIHPLALRRISITASDGRGNATRIDMHELEASTTVSFTKTQHPLSLYLATLFIAGRFFPSPSHLVEHVPDALAQAPEMPGCFRLRQVVIRDTATPPNLVYGQF